MEGTIIKTLDHLYGHNLGHNDEDDEGEEDGTLTLSLGEVTDLLAKHRGCELPTFSPYSALKELINTFKGPWMPATESCLVDSKDKLNAMLAPRIEKTFEQFPQLQPMVR